MLGDPKPARTYIVQALNTAWSENDAAASFQDLPSAFCSGTVGPGPSKSKSGARWLLKTVTWLLDGAAPSAPSPTPWSASDEALLAAAISASLPFLDRTLLAFL